MTTSAADLHADLRLRLGALDLDVTFHVTAGSTVAILGPNGSGKTTVLRCLAGLRPIDEGRIALGDAVLDDPAGDVFVQARHRPIGVMFQDYLLFAHLSSLENVAFGLRARGVARREARETARRLLDQVGLAEHAGGRPRTLSGGQQQRVALARALAPDPAVLLLDEPLAALDASTRAEVRQRLRSQLAGFTGVRVIVTHDPLDAYALADHVLILENGRLTQSGTLAEIAARPRTRYTAQLVGTNLLTGTIRERVFTTAEGAALHLPDGDDGDAYLAVAPAAVALYPERPNGSPRNVWPATIVAIDHAFDRARVTLGAPLPITAELTTAGLAALDRHVGDTVWVSIKATELTAYPA